GAISSAGTLHISGTTFSNNTTTVLGGAVSTGGGATVVNSTFSGNSAELEGGAIWNSGGLSLTNCTLTNNRAGRFGGGLGGYGAETLNNSIVAGNFQGSGITPDDITLGSGVIDTGFNNLIGDPGSAGGLTDGVHGNIVGNGNGGRLDITTVLAP